MVSFTATILGSLLLLTSLPLAVADSVWDYAPDFSRDPIQPYPDLKNPDGTNISVVNIRGVHLFGFRGCLSKETNDIKEAYNDFYTLANQFDVYNNIDWTSAAANDFWGPTSGPNVIPTNTRKEIQQIFAAAQQVYSYPWTWQPPWLSWRQLWIEVRCSDSKLGEKSTDPNNICGDAKPNDGECLGGDRPSGDTNKVEAFSDADPDDSRYSRITFCSGFFNLRRLKEAVAFAKKLKKAQQLDLRQWDNRARCFLHEVTHLDYFMNAGPGDDGESPFVSDLEVNYIVRKNDKWHAGYGPYNAKMIRNHVPQDPQFSGYFTQRNADNYAYFALAKYVEKQIRRYPNLPTPGGKKPNGEPRDLQTHEEPKGRLPPGQTEGQDRDLLPGPAQDPDDTPYSGCPDRVGPYIAQAAIASSIIAPHTSHPTPLPSSARPPKLAPKCDEGALSGVPYNVFRGSASTIYGSFCDAVGKAQRAKLTWLVDSFGNQKKPSARLRWLDERTPPPNPSQYTSLTFELDWAPAAGQCKTNCKGAFDFIAESPCGHQGAKENAMTSAASVDIGCGTYSYKITGPKAPSTR